jgi:hypothetical protein
MCPRSLRAERIAAFRLAALVVGRTDDENLFTCFVRGTVFARDRCVALIWIYDLANAALLLEERDCLSNLSAIEVSQSVAVSVSAAACACSADSERPAAQLRALCSVVIAWAPFAGAHEF